MVPPYCCRRATVKADAILRKLQGFRLQNDRVLAGTTSCSARLNSVVVQTEPFYHWFLVMSAFTAAQRQEQGGTIAATTKFHPAR